MRVEVKVLRTQHFNDPVVILVVDENRAENGLFGIDIVRKRSFKSLT
jgi:hypothetical protein